MKKIISMLCGLMAIVITACSNEEIPAPEIQTPATPGEKVSVKAYAPGDGQDGSRVSFNEKDGTIFLAWETNESFSVICGSENQIFSKTTEGNTFTGVLPTDGTGDYYAFYPANGKATDATAVPFSLVTQTGTLNSASTYMYAESTDGTSYQFKHITAILKTTFTGLKGKIKKVQVRCVTPVSNTINLTTGAITPGDARVITIDYATAIDATSSVYVYLPPMAANAKTLTFMVTTESGYYEGTLAGTADKPIEAGILYTAAVAMASTIPYVTFTAPSAQKLSLTNSVANLQYSTDNGENWTDLGTGPVSFGGNVKLLLRGTSNVGTNGETITFSESDVKVACTGDIRTLVDWELYTIANTQFAKFNNLFYGCTSLETAPALPATTLAESCYASMFYGCTSLETAPALPATTLANYCYNSMFEGCTSLKSAPVLSATTLAEECCYEMFYRCTSLETAPVLNATTLAYSCYNSMFCRCTSLESAPVLPATTLARSCYESMFSGCTSLESAPVLPATTLANYCYNSMFQGCTSLNAVTMLATDINADRCLDFWLSNVASTGTLTKKSATTLSVNSPSGIPDGWSVVNQ